MGFGESVECARELVAAGHISQETAESAFGIDPGAGDDRSVGGDRIGNLRLKQDNVALVLDPVETQTASGIHVVHQRKPGGQQTRFARVLAAGPGHYVRTNLVEARRDPLAPARYRFQPTQVKAGDRVIVDAIAGQDFTFDLDIPRHNKGTEFEELVGEKGEFRVVREDEILGVVE